MRRATQKEDKLHTSSATYKEDYLKHVDIHYHPILSLTKMKPLEFKTVHKHAGSL